jgi:hypothetical protein
MSRRSLIVTALLCAALTAPATAENYAILFAGGADPNYNLTPYYDNTLRMYNLVTGTTLNFLPQNVWVLASDGLDPHADRLYGKDSNWSSVVANGSTVLSATNADLRTTLQNLPTGPADLLYLWTFDHGDGKEGWVNVKDEEALYGWGKDANGNYIVIRDDELANWDSKLVCGRRAYVFGQCYSGGMIDELNISQGQWRFACAATNHYEPSWGDGFVHAFADGISDPNHAYTKTFDLYQHAYHNDPYATGGEGPGGTYIKDKEWEHPWKTGDNLDLAVSVWQGDGAGGADNLWSTAGNWCQQPTLDRTVRVRFASNGRLVVDIDNAQAGYLVVQSDPNAAPGHSYLQLQSNSGLHSICQVVGDNGFGEIRQDAGNNEVDDRLYVGYRAGSSGWYTLIDGNVYAGELSLGRGGDGYVDQYAGTVRAGMLRMGELTSGEGSYNMHDGNLTVLTEEWIGEQGHGYFYQNSGTHVVNDQLVLGQEEGSQGHYWLFGGTLTANQVVIGAMDPKGGYGFFQLNEGNCTVTDMMWIGATGEYRLYGKGQLSCTNMSVLRGGWYRQWDGTSSFTNVYVKDNTSLGSLNDGTMEVTRLYLSSLGRFEETGGSLTVGKMYVSSGGKFTQTGGYLNVTDANCAYVGYVGTGSFEQTAGHCHVYNTLYVGYNLWSSGTYTLDLDANLAGSLKVDGQLRIGADSGMGRFEYLSYVPGTVSVSSVVMGPKGTLAIGFNTNVNNIANGAIFGGAAMTGLNSATLEITNGATVIQDSNTHVFRTVRVGSEDGNGAFNLGGLGNADVRYMEINSGGLMNYSGGSLTVHDGGLHLAGQLDFHGSDLTLEVGDNCLVNLAQGQFLHAGGATLYVTGAQSLTILPAGFDPNQFAGYGNAGREHTAGSTLVVAAGEGYTVQGHIGDHVQCAGTLMATTDGYLYLHGGLEVMGGGGGGGGSVSLGTGILTVNDLTSSLGAGGELTCGGMQIGAAGAGSFLQTGGTNTVSEVLSIGAGAGSSGAYEIQNGSLTAAVLNVGLEGSGTFKISGSGASVTVRQRLHFGEDGSFESAGAVIHMTGSDFENQSTDANALADLSHLSLVFEGGTAAYDQFEVAGRNCGGFTGNFALGGLILGGASVGQVKLVDLIDNGNRLAEFGECLFVSQLTINSGSSLDLNGLRLFVSGDAREALQGYLDDGSIFDGTGGPVVIGYDADNNWTHIPEPATIGLLMLGALAALRRKRR